MKIATLILTALLTGSGMQAQNIDYISSSIKMKSPLTAVNVSPDGRWLLVGEESGNLNILALPELETIRIIEDAASAPIFDIEMSPNMDVIFIASGSRIKLFDTLGVHITNWPHHKNTMWSMDIHPSGDYIVSTEVNKTFQLTNVFEGRIESAMRGHDDITLAVEFSSNGKWIASGSHDKTVKIWDLESKQPVSTFLGLSDQIYDVAFSPDNRYVAACSRDQTVRIWNIEEKSLHKILKGHSDMVLEIEFSPDSRYLISASSDMAIKLWDVESGDQLYAYLENEAGLSDIEFLPDGQSFVSTGMDGYLKTWMLHPEIFVIHFFGEEYEEEISKNPLFEPRRNKEKKSEFSARQKKAEMVKNEIIQRYYQKYLASLKGQDQ